MYYLGWFVFEICCCGICGLLNIFFYYNFVVWNFFLVVFKLYLFGVEGILIINGVFLGWGYFIVFWIGWILWLF